MESKRKDKTVKSNARQDEIVAAALRLLEETGLEGITLRKLAEHLHMQAPSLYWYFKDKRTLIDFMAEKILQKEFSDFGKISDDEDWKVWLTTTMLRLRRAMLSYRDGASVVAGAHLGPAKTLAQIIAYSCESLYKSGLSIEDAQTVVMTALHFTFGRVIEEQESPTEREAKKFLHESIFEKYPYLNQRSSEGMNIDKEFRRSLELIIR